MNSYREIIELFDRHRNFAISAHVNPDGDAIGSELALYSYLKELGKNVRVFNSDINPPIYDFLPFISELETPEDVGDYSPEVLIIVDASTHIRIGEKLAKLLRPTEAIVNIDHHSSAEDFGDYNLVDISASSTAEIVHKLIRQSGIPMRKDRAILLYTGIMFDTGCFRYSNSTPDSHRCAAELIEEGIAVDEIYRNIYESQPVRRVQLLGEALRSLKITEDGKIAWLHITSEMLDGVGTSADDVDGFVNNVREIGSVEVAIVATDIGDGMMKVSTRSKNVVDVGKLCAEFGGGGHKRAAGCTVSEPIELLIEKLIASSRRQMMQ